MNFGGAGGGGDMQPGTEGLPPGRQPRSPRSSFYIALVKGAVRMQDTFLKQRLGRERRMDKAVAGIGSLLYPVGEAQR